MTITTQITWKIHGLKHQTNEVNDGLDTHITVTMDERHTHWHNQVTLINWTNKHHKH